MERDSATDARVAVLIMGQEPDREEIPPYSADLNVAWRVAERVKHLPFDGATSLRQSLQAALAFEAMIRETPLLDMPPDMAARLICETALLAVQEGQEHAVQAR